MKHRHSPEQIVKLLREADVKIAAGKTVEQVCRQTGISEVTYYKWRKSYGHMKVDQVKRLKDLEKENSRLKKLVADLSLDKAMGTAGQRDAGKSSGSGYDLLGGFWTGAYGYGPFRYQVQPVTGGAGSSAGGTFVLSGTIGQPSADVSSGGSYTLRSGSGDSLCSRPLRFPSEPARPFHIRRKPPAAPMATHLLDR